MNTEKIDNQLVWTMGEPRCMQIRSSANYVIFDLVHREELGNGARIHQHKLVPGDVISIAGVPLVFGQEMSSRGETTDYRPAGSGEVGLE
jgi:hypothetical protein